MKPIFIILLVFLMLGLYFKGCSSIAPWERGSLCDECSFIQPMGWHNCLSCGSKDREIVTYQNQISFFRWPPWLENVRKDNEERRTCQHSRQRIIIQNR